MSLTCKIFLIIAAIATAFELRQKTVRYLHKRRRRIVRQISHQRAVQTWLEASANLILWIDSHPYHSNADPEFISRVEATLAAFRRTLRYKNKISARENSELKRLQKLLIFERKEFA